MATAKATKAATEKFEVRNRWTNVVQFTAEITCALDASISVKLGLAVQWAVKADANLADAYLAGAYLADAYLAGAYLAGAYLARANLADANLAGAKDADLAIAKTRILPEGALIGWKKCIGDVIVKLRIPEEAPRSHAFGRKCRAKFADVLEIVGAEQGISQHDRKTTYRVGDRVECNVWDENWQDECSGGIHFYITRAEAEAH